MDPWSLPLQFYSFSFWIMTRSRRFRGGTEVTALVEGFGVGVLGPLAIHQVVRKYFITLAAGWLNHTDEYQSYSRKKIGKGCAM